MVTIKTQINSDLYQKIQQRKEETGFSIATILKLALMSYFGDRQILVANKQYKQSTTEGTNEVIKEEKPKKAKRTALDRLMWDYISAYPNCKVFIENGRVIFQDRQSGNRQQIIPVPPYIEGDQNQYPEGDSIPVVEFERTDQPEFNEFIEKEKF